MLPLSYNLRTPDIFMSKFSRFDNFFELQNIWCSEFSVNNRFHFLFPFVIIIWYRIRSRLRKGITPWREFVLLVLRSLCR